MSVTGIVRNGVVVLPPDAGIPEGAEVKVEALQAASDEDALSAAVKRLAKDRGHLPDDYALNHGYYIRGEAKK